MIGLVTVCESVAAENLMHSVFDTLCLMDIEFADFLEGTRLIQNGCIK